MSNDLYRIVQQVAREQQASVHVTYSGRNMHGSDCIAISGQSIDDRSAYGLCAHLMHSVAGMPNLQEEMLWWIGKFRDDDLGKGWVLYAHEVRAPEQAIDAYRESLRPRASR